MKHDFNAAVAGLLFPATRVLFLAWGRLMVAHRHLLYDEQKAEIVKGLRLRLRQLLEKREDLEAATYAFYALHRLTDPKQGRPRYPEVTWRLIEDYLKGSMFHVETSSSSVPKINRVYEVLANWRTSFFR